MNDKLNARWEDVYKRFEEETYYRDSVGSMHLTVRAFVVNIIKQLLSNILL